MGEKEKKDFCKKEYAELLANKNPETHAAVMKQLGITPEEDKKWHRENGGQAADWSKIR